MNEAKLEFASAVFKMLGHPLRLRLVELLDLHGEQSVNNLAEETEQPQSTVSLYLNSLKNSGLLNVRRDGNQRLYSIANPRLFQLMDCVRTAAHA